MKLYLFIYLLFHRILNNNDIEVVPKRIGDLINLKYL